MVNTSLNEGTPVAIIEAMAARVPVVATAVGGVPDLVIHGSTGLLMPADNAEACADVVEIALRADPALLDRAQQFALETYDLQRSLHRAEALYRSLLPNAS
jgi:glycosyltransferase involved in cell wall biosynthesis